MTDPDDFCAQETPHTDCAAKDWYDYKPSSNDNTASSTRCPHCNGDLTAPEDMDMEPVYATLHFYHDDPDSMRRYRECNQAGEVRDAVGEYAQWLHAKVKYGGDEDGHSQLTEAWNEWFAVFRGRGLPVPGWEE